MNPSSNEAPGLNLPPPVGEPLLSETGGQESGDRAPEQAPSAPEKAPATGQSAPAAAPAIPLPALPQAVPGSLPSDVTDTTSSTSPSILEDTDLIEKEWVNKAKMIVERNREDPHKQSDELTVVRADYMKTHYNKTIKLNK